MKAAIRLMPFECGKRKAEHTSRQACAAADARDEALLVESTPNRGITTFCFLNMFS
jgi:hypothetical protein